LDASLEQFAALPKGDAVEFTWSGNDEMDDLAEGMAKSVARETASKAAGDGRAA
jgi:hypothetical protein